MGDPPTILLAHVGIPPFLQLFLSLTRAFHPLVFCIPRSRVGIPPTFASIPSTPGAFHPLALHCTFSGRHSTYFYKYFTLSRGTPPIRISLPRTGIPPTFTIHWRGILPPAGTPPTVTNIPLTHEAFHPSLV